MYLAPVFAELTFWAALCILQLMDNGYSMGQLKNK